MKNEIALESRTIQLSGSPGEILSKILSVYPDLYYPLQAMHGIKSQVGLHQACGLMLMARQFNGGDILNIGCAYGYSTACLAEGAPDSHILSLDVNHKRLAIAKKNLNRYRKVELLRMRSWAYLEQYAGQRWDMVFVDGCHREIWRDMPFYNQVKVDGLFMSHDYIPARFPFVVEALDSLTVQFSRPFDVKIFDDRGAGVVGMIRQAGEIWRMPQGYEWTDDQIREFQDRE